MNTIAPVDRVGGLTPLLRREYPVPTTQGDQSGEHEPPSGDDARNKRRESPVIEVPTVSPNSAFGKIINTFAISR